MILLTEERAGVREAAALPEVDVRQRLDEAVRRGWAEIGRRVLRRLLLSAGDLAATALAAFLAMTVLRNLPSPAAWGAEDARSIVVFLLFVQPLALGVFGSYGSGVQRTEFGRIARAVGTAAIFSWLFGLTLGNPGAGLGLLGATVYAIWGTGLIFAFRLVFDALITFCYSQGIGQRRVLVIGTPAAARRVTDNMRGNLASEIRVVGVISPRDACQPGSPAMARELERTLQETGARGVIVASDLSLDVLDTLIRQCFEAGATVSLLPGKLHQFQTRLDLRQVRAGVFFEIQPEGLRFPRMATKRAMDVVLSILILLFSWPLFLLIALAIKLGSKGPVLFKQTRAGVGGQPFTMYKFRTMVEGADRMKKEMQHLNGSGDPRLFKIKDDPRVTRVGWLLRKTSLDELPQIFNVLRGEMSLVGPRPFFPEDLKTYEPHHFERLSVLPGITGLWQVSGRSDIVDFEEVVRLDREYIRSWSVTRDLVILVRTIPAAFGRGAY